MIKLFYHDVYYLLNSGSTLSYVALFVIMLFGFGPECILNPFFISTLINDSAVARIVYRGCVLSIGDRETLVDLIELDMVNFDVILAMD